MLFRLRHTLVLLLFVLLPFHAFFVTVGTKLIFGEGNAPELILAIWKEALITLVFLVAIVELAIREKETILMIVRGHLRWTWAMERGKAMVLLLLALAVLLFAFDFDSSLEQFLFGFRYLFIPLIFFAVLRTVTWEERFLRRKLFPALTIVGGIVAAYGIATLFLPQGFFIALGYSGAHSIYSPGSPLSAFQYISDSGIRRIQGTFSGPNQLGVWLLLPWSVGLVSLLRGEWKVVSGKWKTSYFQFSIFNFQLIFRVFFLISIALALALTFSRSAWIAALAIALVAVGKLLKREKRRTAYCILFAAVFIGVTAVSLAAPRIVLRSISNRHHIERLRDGVVAMVTTPLGHGLGSAGPASNRVSDPCLYFERGADTSWAADRPDLCLFVEGVQVQPSFSERACRCPVLTENWYLQIGYELGLLGFGLFLGLVIWILRMLFINAAQLTTYNLQLTTFLAFLGISIAALFLHAFEDAAVAYTVWGMAGIALAMGKKE